MPQDMLDTRGRVLTSPAARCFLPLTLALALVGCAREREESVPNDKRTIVADAGPATASDAARCLTLPDTAVELLAARPDQNDLPLTQIVLDEACPQATVLFTAGARIQRTYRVRVKAGQLLVARARGESGPIAMAFDYPATIRPDSSNFGMSVIDSLRVTDERDVSVRLALIPRLREDARASRVVLTVLVRP